MDIREYIDSGILEQYVAGLLSNEENEEVDRMAEKYPEIYQEIIALRASINNYSRSTGRTPSSDILKKAQEDILNKKVAALRKPEEDTEQVINKSRKLDVFKIAATILLLVSVGLNGFFFSEITSYRAQAIDADNRFNELNEQVSFINSAANVKIPLNGLDVSPESYANVFINKNTRDVYIQVGKLPQPPEGHQYQLWADRDGHMHNIGVFHHNTDIQHIRIFEGDFESLNVTLEVEGGSEEATVENAYLSGKKI